MKRILALILALIIAIACFTGCELSEDNGGGATGDLECAVGQTLAVDNLEFTFVSVEKYVDNSDWALDEAGDGKEFIVFKIKVKNVSDEDQHINMFYEDSYCDDAAIDPVSILFNYNGELLWGDVAAGRVREGYVAYEAPIGWEKIEFIYEELFGGDKITFVAHSKDIVSSDNNDNKGEVSSTVDESQNQEKEPSNQLSNYTCYIGDTVECNGLEFTFLGIEIYVDDSDWALDKAADGKEFVIMKIKIKNVGDSDEYINMYYEDSYCDDVSVDPELLLYNYQGDTIWGDVAVGRIREGYIAYELPIGWEKIEFIYDFSLFSNTNKKVVFVGYSSDIN